MLFFNPLMLKIFEEQSHEIRSILPGVFFQKFVLKIFRKFLESDRAHIQHICNFRVGRYAKDFFFKQVPHLRVSKFNKCQGCLLGQIGYELCHI